MLGESKGLSTDLLGLLDIKIPPEAKADPCKSEIKDLVSNFKRLVMGSDEITETKITSRYVVETKPEVMKDLKELASSGPGFGGAASKDALVSIGLNLDVSKLLDLLKRRSGELKAKPYKCKLLADLNQSAASMDMTFASSMPPVISTITGAQAVLESFTPGPGGMPSSVKGYLLVGSSNPFQLVLILQGMLPQLAGMQLKPSGGPVPIPAQALPPFVKDAKLDIQKTYVAAYVGRKSAPPIPNGRKSGEKVIFHMAYKAGELTKLVNAMTPAMQQAPTAPSIMDNTDITLLVDDKGVVLRSTMFLAEPSKAAKQPAK